MDKNLKNAETKLLNSEASSLEAARLYELAFYEILDTAQEKEFDDVTFLASHICQTPMSMITFLDDKRQWIKSKIGSSVNETPKADSFCRLAIQGDEVLVVENALNHDELRNNIYVKGIDHIRFYAGAPLITSKGFRLGTLCVVDTEPQKLTLVQKQALGILASKVMNLLELRVKSLQIEREKKKLESAFEKLNKYSYMISHDLKAPLNNIIGISTLIESELKEGNVNEALDLSQMLKERGNTLTNLVRDILDYSKSENDFIKTEPIPLNALIMEVYNLLGVESTVKIELPDNFPVIQVERIALFQVVQNFISNAIKFNDKKNLVIKVELNVQSSFYEFRFTDNGIGIPESEFNDIFNIYAKSDYQNKDGDGIGLNSVKTIIENAGGKIWLESQVGIGTTFIFTWPKPPVVC